MHIATVAKSQRSVMSQNDSRVDGSNILTLHVKVVIVADQSNMAHGQTLMTDQTKYASIVEQKIHCQPKSHFLSSLDFVLLYAI